VILFFSAVLVGWVLTAFVRFACLRWQVFDVPNPRSAHQSPTPTLGGVALIIGFWMVIGACLLSNIVLPDFLIGLMGASVGLCFLIRDEVRAMGRLEKLGVQIFAAGVVIVGGSSLESVTLGDHVYEFGYLGVVLTGLFLVMLQNLYNFMDGLDGFAALEGLLVSGALAFLFWTGAPSLARFLLVLGGVTFGFWIWNKPPARIFMGDVGAHFLSLCFGLAAIQGESMGVLPLWMAILPLGAFLFDSIYTLIRRLFRGENITLAHRFHLYQRLQVLGWTPRAINRVYALFTLLFSGCAMFLKFGFISPGYGLLGATAALMGIGTGYVERQYIKVDHGDA